MATNRELKSDTYIVTSIEIDIKSEVLYIGASYVCCTYCNGLPPKEKKNGKYQNEYRSIWICIVPKINFLLARLELAYSLI